MKKKAGERAKILFDDIDLKILNLLSRYESLGVLELVDKIQINHNSLKPHFDKLLSLKLISSYKNKEGKVRLSYSLGNTELIKKQKILLEVLEETSLYYKNKELNKIIDIDLRKKCNTGVSLGFLLFAKEHINKK